MRFLKNVFSQLHTLVLWAMASILLWGWIFGFLTNTKAQHKVTIFIEAVQVEDQKLNLRLEEHLPKGIRMIRVRGIDYSYMGVDNSEDIFLLRASTLEDAIAKRPDSFAEIPLPDGCIGYSSEGRNIGIRVYDAKAGAGLGSEDYIRYYAPGDSGAEDVFLCISTHSLHWSANDKAVDNAAWEVVCELLQIKPE